jgi:hypothetical protein
VLGADRILEQNHPQIKHETGHVQFRVLREKLIGLNSVQLSGSTDAPTFRLPHQKVGAPLFRGSWLLVLQLPRKGGFDNLRATALRTGLERRRFHFLQA